MTDYFQESKQDKSKVVQNMFDKVAPKYDMFNRILSLGLDQIWRKIGIRRLLKGMPQGPVLDMGCGSGDLSGEIKKVHEVFGMDFSAEMLRVAKKKFADIDFTRGDAMNLPFVTESLAGAITAFVVRNVEDIPKCFGEVNRCLKKGGQFVILEFSIPQNPIVRLGFLTYLKIAFPIACSMFRGDQQAYQYLRKTIREFGENVDLVSLLKGAGFSEVSSKPLLGGGVSMYFAKK